jgi:hypothetical protein
MSEHEWSASEEVRILAEIARNDANASNQMSAMDKLRDISMNALRISGVLADITASTSRVRTGEDGENIVESVSMKQVVKSMSPTEKMLRQLEDNKNAAALGEVVTGTLVGGDTPETSTGDEDDPTVQ